MVRKNHFEYCNFTTILQDAIKVLLRVPAKY